MVQTLKDLKSNRMLRLIEKFGFFETLVKENITIFSLTDDSLIEYEDDNNKFENEVEPELPSEPSPVRRRRELEKNMSDVIGMHLIPGFVKTGDFDDEQMMSSFSPSKKLIRINVYDNPKRVVTANCAPIISANNYATNGIVHIVDRVMQNPTKTIGQLIDSDSRFTILKNLIAKTDLRAKLEDQSQHITLFAPTNEAFLKLDKIYLERLLKGQSCIEPLLHNHIMGNTLCLSAIQAYGSVKNSLNILLPIKRVDQKLEINGISVVESDRLGTNGVLHVIDEVIISEKSQPISKFLERHQMTEYLELIKESGLLEEWDALQNVSFFIPSIDSMRTLSPKSLEEIKNKTKEMIEYHIVKPKSDSCDWDSDQMLESMAGKHIRVNVFGDIPGFGSRPVMTAQCAKIVAPNEQICGANIQVVDRFLMPSKGNLIQVLESMQTFSLIREIIKNSKIESELQKGVYTLLAPNDHTLHQQLTEREINSLVSNQSESEKFIRNHLLAEIICCSGVNGSPLLLSSQQIQTLEGSLISAHKSINGRVRFGNARVSSCDNMADNGVIHVINRVLEKKPSLIAPLFPFELIF